MKKLTIEEFVEKSKIIHNNMYDYSLTKYNGQRSSVLITCNKHGHFEQNAGSHMAGAGCPKCFEEKMYGKLSFSTETFVVIAEKIHGKKYNYEKTKYIKSNKNVEITCKNHGIFKQTPSNHLSGHGCGKCAIEKNTENKRFAKEDFIKLAKKTHGDLYDYSLVEYKSSATKIKITCRIHGIFKMTPNSHISKKNGCSKCSKKNRITIEDFKDRSFKIHGKKYDYSQILSIKNGREKNPILCYKHGIFFQSANAHLNQKQGCSFCKTSKGELIIKKIFENENIDFVNQKTFKNCFNPKTNRLLKFDFYLPKYNVCVEYDGRQHFFPIKKFGGETGYYSLVYRDKLKNEYCEKNNIRLVRIKFNESIYNKLKQIINSL